MNKMRGYLTTEFYAVIGFLLFSLFFERVWQSLGIDALVVIAYIYSRTRSKEIPGVRHINIGR